jgi:hypothetical protein
VIDGVAHNLGRIKRPVSLILCHCEWHDQQQGEQGRQYPHLLFSLMVFTQYFTGNGRA